MATKLVWNRKGYRVIGAFWGLVFALFNIFVVNAIWWDCDLRAGATTPCRVSWHNPLSDTPDKVWILKEGKK